MRILIVEDDPSLRRTLAIGLTAEGHTVLAAPDGRSGIDVCTRDKPDLVILDLGLPDISGLEVLRSLRSWSRRPVVVLSARSDSSDKVEALDAGADDYVTKPFGLEELLARIRAAGRRGRVEPPVVEAGELRIDVVRRQVTRAGQPTHLTPTEWALLEALLRTPGHLVRATDLLREVWGPAYNSETNYLRTYMATLRKKLEQHPARPRHLITEPGAGYRFELDPP